MAIEERAPLRRLMTASEVADYARVTPETVRRWVRAEKLKPAGRVPGGQYRFDLADVDTLLGIAPSEPRPSPIQKSGPAPHTPTREEVERHVDASFERVQRRWLQEKGWSQAQIDAEIAKRRRHREATRKAMNDPERKKRMKEALARYWADPENRKKHSDSMRRRHAERRARPSAS
jgi:excisionase family DNA binding protein